MTNMIETPFINLYKHIFSNYYFILLNNQRK